MNVHDYRFLRSERATLEDLIEQTPSESTLTRLSFESRLQDVEEELERFAGDLSTRLAGCRLTFRGPPVVSTHGIDADFGFVAAHDFTKAVTLVGAGASGYLPDRGRVPNSDQYKLLVTGTQPGSFSFIFEDASQRVPLASESSPLEEAIGRLKTILKATTGTDEDLSEAISETPRRALSAVSAFLARMADSSATCALEFRGDVFSFRDSEQVRHSVNRMREDIQEDSVSLWGQFQGYLPNQRRAEFLLEDAEEDFLQELLDTVIAATVLSTSSDRDNINPTLYTPVRIEARTRRVGSGRPRFVITRVRSPD